MLHTIGVSLFSFIVFFFASSFVINRHVGTAKQIMAGRILWSVLFALSVGLMLS